MRMLTVGDIVQTKDVVTIHRDASITEACMLMAARDVDALAVIDESGLCGLVSERDVVRRGDACGTPSQLVSVARIMNADLTSLPTGASIEDALHLMIDEGVQHILLSDTVGRISGLLCMRDVLAAQAPRHFSPQAA
jgi:CBS domain-containing protein